MKRRCTKGAIVFLTVLLLAALTACRHEHEFGDWALTQAATCTQDGQYSRICVCGECETLPAFAKGHTEGPWIVDAEADCGKLGLRHRDCTLCGETVQLEEIPATEQHSFQSRVEKVSTCTQEGTRRLTCTVCGKKESEVIPASHWWVAATCTAPQTCADCRKTGGAPLGHSLSATGKCTRCGAMPTVVDPAAATAENVRERGVGLGNWNGTLPLATAGQQISIMVPINDMVTDYDSNPLTVWVEEQTGLDLRFQVFRGARKDMCTQLMLMFTGGERMPDLIPVGILGQERCEELVQAGYIQNLASYLITDSPYLHQALEEACKGNPEEYQAALNGVLAQIEEPTTGMVYGSANLADGLEGAANQTKWVISWSCREPLLAWRLIDFLYSPEAMLRQTRGVKDVDWSGTAADHTLLTDGQRKDSRWFLDLT